MGPLSRQVHSLVHSCSEQVREEGLLEESLVEDEACEAQHGNATNSHLKLRQEEEESSIRSRGHQVSMQ